MKKSGIKGRMIAVASVGLMCLMALSVFAPVASAATAPSWNYTFAMGGARAQAVVVQADNGVVFVIGGATGIGYASVNTVSAYNPSTGTWVNLAPLTTATRGASGGIGADGRIYIFDGTTQATQIYNITTDTWSAGATMPGASYTWEGKSAISGDHAYVFGGEAGATPYKNLTWIYNMTTDTWWPGKDMLYAVKAGAVVADNGYAYYIGGANVSGMATTNVSRYSFATNSWSRLAPLPNGTCGEAATIGPDGLIYVFGGADSPWNTGMGAVYSATYTYDRDSNTWATVKDMNVARAWLGAAVSDNKILALGGNDPSTVYTIVESLDTLLNQLSNLQNQVTLLQNKVTLLQNQLTQANNDITGLTNQINDLNAKNAQLKQDLADLSAQLNQTKDNLNAALGTTNNNVNNAKSAADSANMIGIIGVILALVAIVIAVVTMLLKKKS